MRVYVNRSNVQLNCEPVRENCSCRACSDSGLPGRVSVWKLPRPACSNLKIDRSFVSDVHQSADNAAVTSAIIALAKSFKLDVIVAGVENTQQLAFIAALGCEGVQGNIFGEALCAEEITEIFLGGGNTSSAEVMRKYLG